jgi:hypothetical protein
MKASTRLARIPSSSPAAEPKASNRKACPNAAFSTSLRCAPRATRMPNSRIRLRVISASNAGPYASRDDELHVLAVAAKGIVRYAGSAGDTLELLAAKQGFIHTIATDDAHILCRCVPLRCSGRPQGVALNERSIYVARASPAQPRNRPSNRGDNPARERHHSDGFPAEAAPRAAFDLDSSDWNGLEFPPMLTVGGGSILAAKMVPHFCWVVCAVFCND